VLNASKNVSANSQYSARELCMYKVLLLENYLRCQEIFCVPVSSSTSLSRSFNSLCSGASTWNTFSPACMLACIVYSSNCNQSSIGSISVELSTKQGQDIQTDGRNADKLCATDTQYHERSTTSTAVL
jgi:hypothetical protein